jgi:hypothetical protein
LRIAPALFVVEDFEDLFERPRAEASFLACDGQGAIHGQGGKYAPIVRNPTDTGAGDLVGGEVSDVLTAER